MHFCSKKTPSSTSSQQHLSSTVARILELVRDNSQLLVGALGQRRVCRVSIYANFYNFMLHCGPNYFTQLHIKVSYDFVASIGVISFCIFANKAMFFPWHF